MIYLLPENLLMLMLKQDGFKNKYGNIVILFKIEYPNSITDQEKKNLKDNFKRKWKYLNDKKNDQHIFWLEYLDYKMYDLFFH